MKTPSVSRRKFLRAAVASVATGSILSASAQAQEEQAQEKAEEPAEQRKLALVVFSAEGCAPCKVLEKELDVLKAQDPSIRINKYDANKVRAGEYGPKVLEDFKHLGGLTPTMILVNEKSQILSAHVGAAPAEEVKSWIDYHRATTPRTSNPKAVRALFDDHTKKSLMTFYWPGTMRDVQYKKIGSALPANALDKTNLIYVNVQDIQAGAYKDHPIEEHFRSLGNNARNRVLHLNPDGRLSVVSEDPKTTEALEKLIAGPQNFAPAAPIYSQ